MKPLQEPCPLTDPGNSKKWNFSGKPLPQEEVDVLTAQGVDWSKDVMPDGRLKFPKFRSDVKRGKKRVIGKHFDNLKQYQEARWIEYEALPEPKPDFFVWAFRRDRRRFFDRLEWIALNPFASQTEATKAISLMAEFAMARPKQQVEISKPVEEPSLSPQELLNFALELNNLALKDTIARPTN